MGTRSARPLASPLCIALPVSSTPQTVQRYYASRRENRRFERQALPGSTAGRKRSPHAPLTSTCLEFTPQIEDLISSHMTRSSQKLRIRT